VKDDSVNMTPVHHERRGMACSCGASLGDQIDWNWHLSNESFEAGKRSITEDKE
jgi:hypothetical protein